MTNICVRRVLWSALLKKRTWITTGLVSMLGEEKYGEPVSSWLMSPEEKGCSKRSPDYTDLWELRWGLGTWLTSLGSGTAKLPSKSDATSFTRSSLWDKVRETSSSFESLATAAGSSYSVEDKGVLLVVSSKTKDNDVSKESIVSGANVACRTTGSNVASGNS